MKKHIKHIIIICVVALSFTNCTENEIETFSGKDLVYFQSAVTGVDGFLSNKIDSVGVTFSYELPSFTDSLYTIPLQIQGFKKHFDRKIKLKVNESSTAILGTHFELDLDNIIIPADSITGSIPIRLMRTSEMRTTEFLVSIEIEPNEHFDTNFEITSPTSNNPDRNVNPNIFQITISDILSEPSKWFILGNWLGDFSQKKLYLLAELNNIPIPNYNEFPDLGAFISHVSVLKAYLIDQKAAGNTIYEEDGSEMTLGPNA